MDPPKRSRALANADGWGGLEVYTDASDTVPSGLAAAPFRYRLRASVSLLEAERNPALERFELLRPALEEGVPLACEQGIDLRAARRWVAQHRPKDWSGWLARGEATEASGVFPTHYAKPSRAWP